MGYNKKKKHFCPIKNKRKIKTSFLSVFLFSLERKKKEKSSRTVFCSPFPLVTIKKSTGLFFIPIQRTCPRFPGKCSAHRAFDFLRKSLGSEKQNPNPSAAA